MKAIISKNIKYLFLYITLVQEISRIEDVNFNCKISFFSDTPVKSERSELQCQQQKSEVSPLGIGTARTLFSLFCFVNLSYSHLL